MADVHYLIGYLIPYGVRIVSGLCAVRVYCISRYITYY